MVAWKLQARRIIGVAFARRLLKHDGLCVGARNDGKEKDLRGFAEKERAC